jgi:hypothetical protein
VIRIDQLWLCTAPMDMRAGAERLMSCGVQTTGAARAHHGYLFANARATRIKLLRQPVRASSKDQRDRSRSPRRCGPGEIALVWTRGA